MESKKTIVGFLTIVIVVLLGFAVSLFFYSNNDNSDNSPSNTQQLSTGNRYLSNFYDKPITDENIALDALETNRSKLGYNNENISFEFITENGYLGSSYRFKTLYKQIPIEPSTIIVTTHSDNRPNVIVSGNIDLSKLEKLNTTPKITQDEALNIAKEALGENFSEYNIFKEKVYPELIIYEKNGEYILTYYIDTGAYICVINSKNGNVINFQSTLCYNIAEYKGQNGDNQQVFYDDFENKKNVLWNKDKNILIFDDVKKGEFNSEKLLTLDNINSGKNKSAIDAMANTYKAMEYFEQFDICFDYVDIQVNDTDELDAKEGEVASSRLAKSIDNINTIAILNFGTKNIFGTQYSAYLDIVGHEYTHCVTNSKAFGTKYSEKYVERNALMEAYSDIFGELIEQAYTGKTDWKSNGGTQDFSNPKIKKYSKRHIVEVAKKKNDWGYAHQNCDIISHTAYLMSKSNDNKNYNAEFLLDYDQLGKLWYRSLDHLDETSDFSDCRLAIEQSANDLIKEGVLLEANLDIIKQAFDEVEVTTDPVRHSLQDALKVADNQNSSIPPTQETTQHEDDISIEIKTEPITTKKNKTPNTTKAQTEPETIAEIPESGEYNNLRYSLLEDNEMIITGCNGITNLEIPSEIYGIPVTVIDSRAFKGMENIVSVKIPDTIKKIGQDAFDGTTWLKNKVEENPIVIENGYLLCWEGYIEGDITIPSGVKCIANNVFFDREKITSVTIPNEVVYIGDYAFAHCSHLTNIVLPNNLISIGIEAFNDCSQLISIEIPNGTESIGDFAFSGCENLVDITIPETITDFGNWCFAGYVGTNTPWLEKKREENPLVIINNIVIDGRNCTGDVIIPDTVIKIADGAFQYSELNSINIPDSIESIGNSSFYACKNLSFVTVPKSVKKIGGGFSNGAFGACEGLEEITFLNPECEIPLSQYTIYNKTESEGNYNTNWYYDGVIKGYENSTAQEYAERYNYEFVALEN